MKNNSYDEYVSHDNFPTLGDGARYRADDNLSTYAIGQRYNAIDTDLRSIIDGCIKGGWKKIPTIKYLRRTLALSLIQAKELYEAREEFLSNTNKYGFCD